MAWIAIVPQLGWFNQGTNGAVAPTVEPRRFEGADEPASPGVPPTASHTITATAVVASFWTDTDDKDSEENVSLLVTWEGRQVGVGGPWGGGEIWGDQEDRNQGQPHLFEVSLTEEIPSDRLHEVLVRVTKSQHGGNGGKGWHVRIRLGIKPSEGDVQWCRETDTVRLGDGNAAEYETTL